MGSKREAFGRKRKGHGFESRQAIPVSLKHYLPWYLSAGADSECL